jgi:CRP-like cAMP-binding protein
MSNVLGEAVEKQLATAEQIERWPVGMILFSEGEAPRGLFVIHSGVVDLEFSGRNGVSKSLRIAHPGEVVGLGYAVSNTPYDCTARVRTSVKLGFVPLMELQRMLDEAPSLWLTMAHFLSEDINACWASMRTLSASR